MNPNKQLTILIWLIFPFATLSAQNLHPQATPIHGDCNSMSINLPLSIQTDSPQGVGIDPVTKVFRMENKSEKIFIQLKEICNDRLQKGNGSSSQVFETSSVELAPKLAVNSNRKRKSRRSFSPETIAYGDSLLKVQEEHRRNALPDTTQGELIIQLGSQDIQVHWKDQIKGRYDTLFEVNAMFYLGKDWYWLSSRCRSKDKEGLLEAIQSLKLISNDSIRN